MCKVEKSIMDSVEEESIQKYLHQILKLKRSASYGGAPHKPILLLSLFEIYFNIIIAVVITEKKGD